MNSNIAQWFSERGNVTLGNFEGYEVLKTVSEVKLPENDYSGSRF
jgi:hypothetical protein